MVPQYLLFHHIPEVSLNTPNQLPQVTTLNPSLPSTTRPSPRTNAPALTDLTDDPCGAPADDAAGRDDHVRWDDGARQDLDVLADDAEGAEDGAVADVDMRRHARGADDAVRAHEHVVADLHRVVGEGAARDAARRLHHRPR